MMLVVETTGHWPVCHRSTKALATTSPPAPSLTGTLPNFTNPLNTFHQFDGATQVSPIPRQKPSTTMTLAVITPCSML